MQGICQGSLSQTTLKITSLLEAQAKFKNVKSQIKVFGSYIDDNGNFVDVLCSNGVEKIYLDIRPNGETADVLDAFVVFQQIRWIVVDIQNGDSHCVAALMAEIGCGVFDKACHSQWHWVGSLRFSIEWP